MKNSFEHRHGSINEVWCPCAANVCILVDLIRCVLCAWKNFRTENLLWFVRANMAFMKSERNVMVHNRG